MDGSSSYGTMVLTAGLAMLGYCVTIFIYVHTRFGAMSEKIDLKIESLRTETAKARHDLANRTSGVLAEAGQRLGTLEREVVRHSDLSAIEARIMKPIDEMKSDFKAFCEKMVKDVQAIQRTVDRLEMRKDPNAPVNVSHGD